MSAANAGTEMLDKESVSKESVSMVDRYGNCKHRSCRCGILTFSHCKQPFKNEMRIQA